MAPRKLALTIFFASVVINAVFGIIALFVGEFGDVQGKILITSLSISAASVLSLAMFPARERGLLTPVPTMGIGLSIIGFGLFTALAWTDFRNDGLSKLAATFLIFAGSAGYVSLISLAAIQPKFINIVRTVYVLVAILAVMIVGAIWGEPEDKNLLRVMGTMAIVLTAATITIPVLHRLNRNSFSGTTRLDDRSGRQPLRCVSCGSSEISTDDGSTYECGACQTRFHARIVL